MGEESQRWLPRCLLDSGYRCSIRRDNWIECLVWSDRERWLGRGPDEVSAIRDGLSQMFPSLAAQRLLTAQLEQDREGAHKLDPRGVRAERPRGPEASAPDSARAAVHPLPLSTPVTPDVSANTSPVVADEVPAPAPTTVVSVAGACQALDDIYREIEDARAELALMAPRLQKRLMVAWICRTRSFDEQFVGEARVTTGVRRVARVLTDLSKTLWPGSVRALQMNALPECALSEINPSSSAVLRTWTQASQFVDEHREHNPDVPASFDVYGWADHQHIGTAPPNPDSLLHDAQTAIERVAGSVTAFPPHHRSSNVDDITQETLVALAVHVQRLRWIRTFTLEPELWGATMGRLRWLASRLGQRATPLRKFLDPEYVPQDTWSRLLGHSASNNSDHNTTPGAIAEKLLIDQVMETVRGKRVLYVSDHDDPKQKMRLEQLLSIKLEWCDGSPDQVQAAEGELSRHAYELVIVGTGFQSQRIDAGLVRTARGKEIPHVRVYQGDLRAIFHALARRYGIKQGLQAAS